MRPYDKVILLVSVLVSWTVAGMPSAAAGAPGMDIPSMQPRIATLKDKVESLESEYGVRFVYSSDINLERPYIGVRAEAAENAVESGSAEGLEAALDRVFRGTGISWKKHRRYIMLGLEPPIEVRDSIRTMAGTDGIPERNDTIAESRITTDRYIREINRTQTGLTRIDGEKFNRGFAFLSSPDLIKTIQSLPGVAGGTELMSGLYVHGGTGTDNLFLLDGVPLYQVSHLAGLFSSFNTDVVESVDFYKSGFPARYGGRLSSVVDVRTREGDFEEYHGLFSIGLIDGRLQYEGPIVRGKTSFNVAMRRSWLDILMIPGCKIASKYLKEEKMFDVRYSFYDINGKITHRFSRDNWLSLNFYTGRDGFRLKYQTDSDEQEAGEPVLYNTSSAHFIWGNLTASLDWDYRIDDRMHTNVTAWYTMSNGRTGIGSGNWSGPSFRTDIEENNFSVVRDFGIKTDCDWIPSDRHHVRYGAGYQFHTYSPFRKNTASVISEGEDIPVGNYEYATVYHGHEASVYIEDEIAFGSRFSANAGLRYVLFAVPGKAYNALEPRVALKYSISPAVSVKVSYTEMNQFNHSVSTVYMDLPTGLLMPSTEKIKPLHSRQAALGVYSLLPRGFHLNMEGFFKTMDNILEYDGLNGLYPPLDEWEISFVPGKGRSFGAELELGYDTGNLDIDAYYTLSWTQRKFDSFYPQWYSDRFDNRHKVTVTASYRLTDGIDMYASWNYHSGNRVTVPDQGLPKTGSAGNVYYDYLYSKPYNARLPDYHRLDFGLNFHKTTKRGNESIWNLSFYNAYCRMNALFSQIQEGDNGRYYGEAIAVFPIIPSFSYTLKF